MNKFANSLGLSNTYFSNSHGLMSKSNVSTACDLAKLCHLSMNIVDFRKYVKTYSFTCRLKNNKSGLER